VSIIAGLTLQTLFIVIAFMALHLIMKSVGLLFLVIIRQPTNAIREALQWGDRSAWTFYAIWALAILLHSALSLALGLPPAAVLTLLVVLALGFIHWTVSLFYRSGK